MKLGIESALGRLDEWHFVMTDFERLKTDLRAAAESFRGATATALIDEVLAEQSQLTAVEAFARTQNRHEGISGRYRELIPLSAPPPGGQYAFEVNLDQCSGCKACVTACHSLNGLDEGEAWRSVGSLVSTDGRQPFRQTITTACHHCLDPACLHGCPVLAYEKDSVTGIVRHLDDQCIGCQYCLMMCPYDAPKYSASRGIVRKCDMCSQRLAVGEAPACVQACPNEAIRISLVEAAAVRDKYSDAFLQTAGSEAGEFAASEEGSKPILGGHSFLPASPEPALTFPTTRFVSEKRAPTGLIPGDAALFDLQPSHAPLVFMLVLTQLSVGASFLFLLLPGQARTGLLLVSWAAATLGITASVLHLGRPLGAWRSFLGLRRSWLSREIVLLGIFQMGILAVGATAMGWIQLPARVAEALASVTAMAGLLGVISSGMIYHATRRVFWKGMRSVGRFMGTTLVLGLAAAWFAATLGGAGSFWIPMALAAAATFKLAAEHRLMRRRDGPLTDVIWPNSADFDRWSLARSARLTTDPLGLVWRGRLFCGWTGGVLLPLGHALVAEPAGLLAFLSLLLCLSGEWMERYLFFRAVVPPRMPGGA